MKGATMSELRFLRAWYGPNEPSADLLQEGDFWVNPEAWTRAIWRDGRWREVHSDFLWPEPSRTLADENQALRDVLVEHWTTNHAEYCDVALPCKRPGGCACPPPEIIRAEAKRADLL